MHTTDIISLHDLLLSFSDAIDLINPTLQDHHKQVAYIAYQISTELGLSINEQNHIILAGLLHDIGAITLSERLALLEFEVFNPQQHASLGEMLLRTTPILANLAPLVRYHHAAWKVMDTVPADERRHFMAGNILHLADRVAMLMRPERENLSQSHDIRTDIASGGSSKFSPEIVAAFDAISSREHFWLDMTATPILSSVLQKALRRMPIPINMEQLLSVSDLFGRIVDFRSRYSISHSAVVGTVAKNLGEHMGLSHRETEMLAIAGNLHEIGMLSVPAELLDDRRDFVPKDMDIVKKHSLYTYRILDAVPGLKNIAQWAGLHHERIDGSGYPFHFQADDLPLCSRIVAVSDVYAAMIEDRPHRKKLPLDQALHTVMDMAGFNKLDKRVAQALDEIFDPLNEEITRVQADRRAQYEAFKDQGR